MALTAPEVLSSNIPQILEYLENFDGAWLGGRWSFQNFDQIHRLNPSFVHLSGKTKFKTRVRGPDNEHKFPQLEVYLKMYDSYYVNQNIEITAKFEITTDPSQQIKLVKQEFELSNGWIFTNKFVDNLFGEMDLLLNLDEDRKNKSAIINITFTEDVKLNIVFDNSVDPHVNSNSIFFYSGILFLV
mmetsp:Transcript_6959/g.6135  ORF Transcript_6959/g.6135 Transcript_6959/m.6135 type:complete len:186 (+) Transcript_6959:267-824(+)